MKFTTQRTSQLFSLGLMSTPHQSWIRLAPLFLVSMLLSGCVTHRDIAADSQYPSDYVLGAVYRTKQDLVAQREGSPWLYSYDIYMLKPPTDFPRLSDVQAQPKHFARQYVIVPVDTDVRIERFDLERNMENGTFVWVDSRVLGGPLAGDELNLTFVSRVVGQSALKTDLLMVDTNLLEQIQQR